MLKHLKDKVKSIRRDRILRLNLNFRNYISKSQHFLAWILTAGFFLGLAGALFIVFQSKNGLGAGTQISGIGGSLRASLVYALTCAFFQVLGGLILAISLRRIGGIKSLRLLLTGALIAIYSLQPAVVHEIWVNHFSFSSYSFSVLVLASIWQFLPFSTLFFLNELDKDFYHQETIAETEVPRWRGLIQIYTLPVLKLALGLLWLRFLWMLTKFDLIYAFQASSQTEKQLVTVRIGKATSIEEYETWTLYLFLVVAICMAIFILALAVIHLLKSKETSLRVSPHYFLAKISRTTRSKTSTQGKKMFSWVTALALIILYLYPLFSFVLKLVKNTKSFSFLVEYINSSLISTFIIGLLAATTAGVVGSLITYASRRGNSTLTYVWVFSLVFVYGVPLVVLSIVAKPTADFLGDLLLNSFVLDQVFRLGGHEAMAWFMGYLPSAIVALFAYFIFATPFVIVVLYSKLEREGQIGKDDLAIVDGARPGFFSLQRRVVLRDRWRDIAYSMFFAFLIIWQDLSLPLRLNTQNSFKWASYEWFLASSQEGVGYEKFLLLAIMVSLIFGAIHITLEWSQQTERML